MPLISLAVYTMNGNELTVSKAFKTLLYFEILKVVVFIFMPMSVQQLGKISKSLRRVEVCTQS